jgi:hypothetical protein
MAACKTCSTNSIKEAYGFPALGRFFAAGVATRF